MKFARYTFLIAGIYGIAPLAPMYFLLEKTGADSPPAVTHPEFYYGFVGVALAWQFVFLIISRNPPKYRALMLPAIFEKFSFAIAAAVLFSQGNLAAQMFAAGMIDLLLGICFIAAFFKTPAETN